jgi:hypothetical protein
MPCRRKRKAQAKPAAAVAPADTITGRTPCGMVMADHPFAVARSSDGLETRFTSWSRMRVGMSGAKRCR